MAIITKGRQPFPCHGKRYNGVPSNSGRVEATEEPRVYGNAEDAIITKQRNRQESLECRKHSPHDRMAPESCPTIGSQPVHISSIPGDKERI
jgi:hypothetical protein